MGSGGAKKTNALAEEQQRMAQEAARTAASRSADIYSAGRGDVDFARQGYKDLFKSIGAGGTGGGGGGYTPASFTDETRDFWRNLMTTGGYSPEELGIMRSASTAPIRGMADMVKQGLETTARGAGTGGGYTSGLGKLFQDQAYAASEASKGAEANILQMLESGREKGATGLEDIEEKRRAFEAAERARQAAHAGAGRASAAADEATKERLLGKILGIEGDRDLAYMDRQLGGIGQGTQAVSIRRDETPMWQKMAGSLLSGAGSAALGAFTGGAGPAVLGALKKGKTSGPVEDQLAG